MFNLGNVYVLDTDNNRIRKVTVSTGIITTIAGTGSTIFSGDNGAATSAALYFPRGAVLDASGRAAISSICCTISYAVFRAVYCVFFLIIFNYILFTYSL